MPGTPGDRERSDPGVHRRYPEISARYRVPYRWYTAFVVLTAVIAVLVSIQQMLGD